MISCLAIQKGARQQTLHLERRKNTGCLFEQDFCNWKPTGTWLISKFFPFGFSLRDWQGTDGGFTYHKGCSRLANGGSGCYGSLKSPHIFSKAGWKCLQFWYYIGKEGHASLRVTLISNETQRTLLTSSETGIWTFARLPIIPFSVSYQVLFQGRTIAIDDVVFQTESCERMPCNVNGSCLEFRQGFYGWVNSEKSTTPWKQTTRNIDERSTYAKQGVEKESNYQMNFPANHSGYVNITDLPDLSAFTICLWMKSSDNTSAGTPLWYRVRYENNGKYVTAIALIDYGGFYVYVGEKKLRTSARANDGKWHHICLAWKSIDGKVYFYFDKGQLLDEGFFAGDRIPGKWLPSLKCKETVFVALFL